MKANLKRVSRTVLVQKDGQMVAHFSDFSSMESEMATVFKRGPITKATQATTKIAISMALALTSGQMAANSLAHGKTRKYMASECKTIQTVDVMKVFISWISAKATVSI